MFSTFSKSSYDGSCLFNNNNTTHLKQIVYLRDLDKLNICDKSCTSEKVKSCWNSYKNHKNGQYLVQILVLHSPTTLYLQTKKNME